MARMNKWDRTHAEDVVAYQKRIRKAYISAIAKIAASQGLIPSSLTDKPFALKDYPLLAARIDSILQELGRTIEVQVTNGIREEWALSQDKNDSTLPSVLDTEASKAVRSMRSSQALGAFIGRKTAGLTISDRVWKYTDQYRTEIEQGLEVCIRDGVGANRMATRMKQYLQYPDKLFRRRKEMMDDGTIRWHLSKAAAQFHPGRGVYRSSFKNARRLVATETNMAYRLADAQRWADEPQVVGIEVRLSNNHPVNDICDDLKGKYPKDFVFTGWHPLCRCYAVPVLKTTDEMAEDLARIMDGQEVTEESVRTVSGVPEGFIRWVDDNRGRLGRMKNLPFFVAYNERYVPQMNIAPSAVKGAREARKMAEELIGR